MQSETNSTSQSDALKVIKDRLPDTEDQELQEALDQLATCIRETEAQSGKKLNNRRNLLMGLVALGGVTALSSPREAEALGVDAAIIQKFLMGQVIPKFPEVIDKVNRFVGGRFDMLSDFLNQSFQQQMEQAKENADKLVTAQGASTDAIINDAHEREEHRVHIASTPPPSTCTEDALASIGKVQREENTLLLQEKSRKEATDNLENPNPIAQERKRTTTHLDKFRDNPMDINAAQAGLNPNGYNRQEAEAAEAFRANVKGDLLQSVPIPDDLDKQQSESYLARRLKLSARVSLSDQVFADIQTRRTGSEDAFKAFRKQLVQARNEATDARLKAFLDVQINELDTLGKKTDNTLSDLDREQFSIRLRKHPAYMEYVRQLGPEPAPYLREINAQIATLNETVMQLALRAESQQALLSALLNQTIDNSDDKKKLESNFGIIATDR